MIAKAYKEIDILIGSDLKNNSNLEFRYAEPKKLKDIERFFIEFYVFNNKHVITKMFQDNTLRQCKYIDYDMISMISEVSAYEKSKNKSISAESILNKIEEMINQRKKGWDTYKSHHHYFQETQKDVNNVSNLFIIQSELKPYIGATTIKDSNKDTIKDKDEHNRNPSISISRIEDFDNYYDNEIAKENMNDISNNISIINTRELNKEDDMSILLGFQYIGYDGPVTITKKDSKEKIALHKKKSSISANDRYNKDLENKLLREEQMDNQPEKSEDKEQRELVNPIHTEENKSAVVNDNEYDKIISKELPIEMKKTKSKSKKVSNKEYAVIKNNILAGVSSQKDKEDQIIKGKYDENDQ